MITAGPTRESLDPVRFLSNRSTGKMGYALANQAMLRGAEVTLITGPVQLTPPPFVKVVPVESAAEMYEAVTDVCNQADIIIKSAAVADYRPAQIAENKIKKKEDDMTIPLTRTTDILAWLGEHKKKGQFICGFSMETENMLDNSRKKLEKKHIDMIVANNVKQQGAGFGTDTNIVTFITKQEEMTLPVLTKEEVADRIYDAIIQKM